MESKQSADYSNHALRTSQLLQPLRVQQGIIIQNLHRQPLFCQDLTIIHHNRMQEEFFLQPDIIHTDNQCIKSAPEISEALFITVD